MTYLPPLVVSLGAIGLAANASCGRYSAYLLPNEQHSQVYGHDGFVGLWHCQNIDGMVLSSNEYAPLWVCNFFAFATSYIGKVSAGTTAISM